MEIRVFLKYFVRGCRMVFAESGKMLCSILELIDLVKSGVKKILGYFYQFLGIVSIPVTFLEFNLCVSFFISIPFTN